jgi:hypothetical protein
MRTTRTSSTAQKPQPGPPPSPFDAIGPDHPGYRLIYEPRRRHSRWAIAATATGLFGLLLCTVGMGLAAPRIGYIFDDWQPLVMEYVYLAATARIGFGAAGLIMTAVAGCRKNRRRELVWIAAALNLILLLSGGVALGYVPLVRIMPG